MDRLASKTSATPKAGVVRTSVSAMLARSFKKPVASSCAKLLKELAPAAAGESRLLHFDMPDGRDVYNITAPFEFDGQRLIAGRVEHREVEEAEMILFRHERDDRWVPYFRLPEFCGLQDPCVTLYRGELILGGVRFPVRKADGNIGWQMDFYRGHSLKELRHFFRGPMSMKDIRMAGLADGRMAVFSRPQGRIGGRGKIGFTIAPTIERVTAAMITEAPLLENQFLDEEWGGANEVHLLASGLLGVLGHIACMDDQGHRHYYPMAFCVEPETRKVNSVRLIAARSFFPDGPTKRPDLADVVFSGGLVRLPEGKSVLYAGISDAAAACVSLPDPFRDFD